MVRVAPSQQLLALVDNDLGVPSRKRDFAPILRGREEGMESVSSTFEIGICGDMGEDKVEDVERKTR